MVNMFLSISHSDYSRRILDRRIELEGLGYVEVGDQVWIWSVLISLLIIVVLFLFLLSRTVTRGARLEILQDDEA